MVSLPIGAVRLTQTFLHHDPPKKKELEQMRGFIQREVSRIQKRIADAKLQISHRHLRHAGGALRFVRRQNPRLQRKQAADRAPRPRWPPC